MNKYEGQSRRKLPHLKQGVHNYNKKAGRDKDAVRVVQERDGILFPHSDYQQKLNGNTLL